MVDEGLQKSRTRGGCRLCKDDRADPSSSHHKGLPPYEGRLAFPGGSWKEVKTQKLRSERAERGDWNRGEWP